MSDLTALATTKVETTIPSKNKWENKRFCTDIVISGSNVLNELLNNKNIKKCASKSKYFNNSVDRINQLTEPIEERFKTGTNNMERYIEVLHSLVENLKEIEFKLVFSHNDLTINNYGFSNGIQPIYDWENSGLYDPRWDISSFETGIIGEYIRYNHNRQFVQDMREKFHDKLEYSVENEKQYDMFRLYHILMVLSYLNQDTLNKYWDNISDTENALKIKKRQFRDIVSKHNY